MTILVNIMLFKIQRNRSKSGLLNNTVLDNILGAGLIDLSVQ